MRETRFHPGRRHLLLLLPFLCLTLPAAAQQGGAGKGRKQIAAWIVLQEEKGFDRFYASDAESTEAHLETVDGPHLPGIGFRHFSSVDEPTWRIVSQWMKKQ